MKNPFLDFHPDSYGEKESSVACILRKNQDILESVTDAYFRLAKKEVKNLAWPVEHNRVIKVYNDAVRAIAELQYDRYDIEAFCAELDCSDEILYTISGPLGLYISALINCSSDTQLLLRLQDYNRVFHFLGYALPKDKTLIIEGDGGEFTGAGLRGGHLIVKGSVGNWCGAGMIDGQIHVEQNSGLKTGEWMHGGAIAVEGRIQGVGETRYGGMILVDGEQIK